MSSQINFTDHEKRLCAVISQKEKRLREYLNENQLPEDIKAVEWFQFLVGAKNILGNINNDISFTATLIIKSFLKNRFSIEDFDAGAKAQGAPGMDIEAKTIDGKVIVGELKTTKPYQPGFGAAQRTSILKDLAKLAKAPADYRFMFVTDDEAFTALSRSVFASHLVDIEVVNLMQVAAHDASQSI